MRFSIDENLGHMIPDSYDLQTYNHYIHKVT